MFAPPCSNCLRFGYLDEVENLVYLATGRGIVGLVGDIADFAQAHGCSGGNLVFFAADQAADQFDLQDVLFRFLAMGTIPSVIRPAGRST